MPPLPAYYRCSDPNRNCTLSCCICLPSHNTPPILATQSNLRALSSHVWHGLTYNQAIAGHFGCTGRYSLLFWQLLPTLQLPAHVRQVTTYRHDTDYAHLHHCPAMVYVFLLASTYIYNLTRDLPFTPVAQHFGRLLHQEL